MKFPFLSKSAEITVTTAAAPSWPWASCAASPKTLSFRANKNTTISSCSCDFSEYHDETIPSSESAVIRGMRSDRLFFEPGETNSILEEAKTIESSHYDKDNVVMVEIDSHDPFLDFRVSMAEMVEAHQGLKNWKYLEDLLEWYLRVNRKGNHGYIAEAFIDLVIHLDAQYCSQYSFTCSSRNCLSSLGCSSSSLFFNG